MRDLKMKIEAFPEPVFQRDYTLESFIYANITQEKG